MKKGLVYGQRYDFSWYGPVGDSHAAAKRLTGYPIGRLQRSGAVLYAAPGDDPERVAIWIPAAVRPEAHESRPELWIDDIDDDAMV